VTFLIHVEVHKFPADWAEVVLQITTALAESLQISAFHFELKINSEYALIILISDSYFQHIVSREKTEGSCIFSHQA
jgi:hypothetical protein